MSDKKEKKQVSIELPEELAQGFYSNLAVVNHSPTEFVVDFISMMPGMPKAKVKRCISRCRYGRALIFSKKFGWLLPSPLLLLVLLFLICSTTFLSKSRELHTYLVPFLFFYSN